MLGRLSVALKPGRSQWTEASALWCLMNSAVISRARSCLQVYRPWFSAVLQQLMTCLAVQAACWHSGHEGGTFMFHLARLVGVGRSWIDALARKESWPAGRGTSGSLFCMEGWLTWWSHCSEWSASRSSLAFLGRLPWLLVTMT